MNSWRRRRVIRSPRRRLQILPIFPGNHKPAFELRGCQGASWVWGLPGLGSVQPVSDVKEKHRAEEAAVRVFVTTVTSCSEALYIG